MVTEEADVPWMDAEEFVDTQIGKIYNIFNISDFDK
jgi:hypothetical protein